MLHQHAVGVLRSHCHNMLCFSSARPPCSWSSSLPVHSTVQASVFIMSASSAQTAQNVHACMNRMVVPEVQRIAGLLQEHAAMLELPPTEWYEETFKQDDASAMNTTTVRALNTMRLLA